MGGGGGVDGGGVEKGAGCVLICNQAGVPIVFLHDVNGFMVGVDSEQEGIIRRGAKLVNAVSNSVVPRISVILGGSYGAGHYAMSGKAYAPRFVFALPSARYAVMGGEQAAQTLLEIKVRQLEKEGRKLAEAERELTEALKRRCLYLWLDYPEAAHELAIVRLHAPELPDTVARKLVEVVQMVRDLDLKKPPSIAESIDWARALLLLGAEEIDEEVFRATMSIIVKHRTDLDVVAERVGVRLGLAARSGMKVRQPLRPAVVPAFGDQRAAVRRPPARDRERTRRREGRERRRPPARLDRSAHGPLPTPPRAQPSRAHRDGDVLDRARAERDDQHQPEQRGERSAVAAVVHVLLVHGEHGAAEAGASVAVNAVAGVVVHVALLIGFSIDTIVSKGE